MIDRLQRVGHKRPLSSWERTVMRALRQAGLKPHLFCTAASGSCYIRFRDVILGSLRIADHGGKRYLRYKWEISPHHQVSQILQEGERTRHMYRKADLAMMVRDMGLYLVQQRTRASKVQHAALLNTPVREQWQ